MLMKCLDFEVSLASLLAPFFIKTPFKICLKKCQIFYIFLGSTRLPKSSWNRSKIHIKFNRNLGWIFVWFLEPFWLTFGGVLGSLDPPKWVSRLGEVLFFEKSGFSGQMRFWVDFLWIFERFWSVFGIGKPSKNEAKNATYFKRFFNGFWHPFWLQMGSMLATFSAQKNHRNFAPIFSPFGRPFRPDPAAKFLSAHK